MHGLLYKWLFVQLICAAMAGETAHHPVFISVTEIGHNAKDKTLEVSCKIFTDDFEKTLRAAYKTHVDLSDAKIKPAMDKLVSDYVLKHLQLVADGKPVILKYLGFEKIEEGIYSYYQADNIPAIKKIQVTDDILFEFSDQQMNLVHVIVNGERKSTKLDNPERFAVFNF